MEFAVKTTQLAKVFSGREVLRDCSLAVERGTVYGLLGHNGAGKTTLFKLLLGYLKPAMGKAEVLGMDSVKDNREILRRTGSLIEAPVFYEHLSAEENLRIHLAYMEMPGKTICCLLYTSTVVFVIVLQDGERRIPVQYSKKLQGRKDVYKRQGNRLYA